MHFQKRVRKRERGRKVDYSTWSFVFLAELMDGHISHIYIYISLGLLPYGRTAADYCFAIIKPELQYK